MIKFGNIILLSLILMACSKPAHRDIQQAVATNQKAKSVIEWDSAKENPKQLFHQYRNDQKTELEIGKDVCEALLVLNGQELSIFENEIKNADNAELLESCREQLNRNLEKYWKDQKRLLPGAGNLNFKFQAYTEKRDLSKGYRAATGDVQAKELVLTFDDGPDPEITLRIMSVLKAVNAKVMFFPLGKQVDANPGVVYLQATEGHSVGSHSNSHLCLANNSICAKSNKGKALTTAEAVAEIRKGHQSVYNVLGFVEPFFRFPYGESDPQLKQYLAEHKVAQMYWNIDSTDWKAQSNSDLLAKVLDEVERNQRGIVLFHDIHRRTLEIMPAFLKAIHERGYNLVVLQSSDENARYNSQLVTKRPVLP